MITGSTSRYLYHLVLFFLFEESLTCRHFTMRWSPSMCSFIFYLRSMRWFFHIPCADFTLNTLSSARRSHVLYVCKMDPHNLCFTRRICTLFMLCQAGLYLLWFHEADPCVTLITTLESLIALEMLSSRHYLCEPLISSLVQLTLLSWTNLLPSFVSLWKLL